MRHYLFCLLAAACSIQAGIVSGNETVQCGWNLSFSPHPVTQNTSPRNAHDGGNVYACSTAIGTIDLFIATYGLYVCAYICRNIAIGSPQPFFVSRKPYSSQDLLRPLNPNDTTRFSRCDTVRRDMHIPSLPQGDSTHCYLPHIDASSHDVSPLASGCFLLLKTSAGKYAIAILDPVFSQGIVGTYIYTYLSDFRVRWHLQTDGSLNFGDITGIKMQDPQNSAIAPAHIGKKVISQGIYNIRGQRISAHPQGPRKTAGVTLVRTRSGVMRVFMCGTAR